MEHFYEEHSKFLLSKEWLVKSDSQTSTPYLFKSHYNTADLSCCLIITDMKSVWVEVLTSAQFARRWRICNTALAPPYTEDSEEEDAWRAETLQLLSRAHTLGATEEVSFEIVPTAYSDLAFELVYETFKWRWETSFLGRKSSAEIISKHLIFPLISLNHLAFSSPQAINDLSDADIEKAVDKVGRTARRSVDTHIKNAISKPRMASALRRMTALVNFNSDLPRVISTAEKPDLEVAQFELKHLEPPFHSRPITVASPIGDLSQSLKSSHVENGESLKPPVPDDDNSATEESDGDNDVMNEKLPNISSQPPPSLSNPKPVSRTTSAPRLSPMPTAPKKDESDSDSSTAMPVKKPKRRAPESSSDDSEEERKRRVAQLKGGSGSGSGSGKRGTRQPIKRGGKRF